MLKSKIKEETFTSGAKYVFTSDSIEACRVCPEKRMPGIDNPNVIDLIADSPERNEVKLIIVETRTWDGSKQEEDRLLEKIDSYISFVEGGQIARMYPQFAGRHFHIQVDCIVPPPPKVRSLLFQANEQLTQFKNIKVSWHQVQ